MASYTCVFVTTRILYPILALAVFGFAIFLSCDFLVTTIPFSRALYDLDYPVPNRAVSATDELAHSAVMSLTYPGHFYRFTQQNGDVCLAYSLKRFESIPQTVVYLRPELVGTGHRFIDGMQYQCVVYDNLDEIQDSFYLRGMRITLIVSVAAASLVLLLSWLGICCCCSGWATCACDAWCVVCSGRSTVTRYEVYQDKGSTFARQI